MHRHCMTIHLQHVVCEWRTHLSCGVACSCDACAGVPHRDQHAPWPGSLTSRPIHTLLDRRLGTRTSVRTLSRCRTRTPREATHRSASSLNTSWMQDPEPLLQLHRTIHTLSLNPLHVQHVSYAPLVIGRMFSSYSWNMAVCSSSLPL